MYIVLTETHDAPRYPIPVLFAHSHLKSTFRAVRLTVGFLVVVFPKKAIQFKWPEKNGKIKTKKRDVYSAQLKNCRTVFGAFFHWPLNFYSPCCLWLLLSHLCSPSSFFLVAGGITDGKEEEMEGLELDKVEEIATQMDGEVPSMSGSHGNLSDRSHHRIVGRELRVVVTTGLAHFTLHFPSRQSILSSSRGVFGINTSH